MSDNAFAPPRANLDVREGPGALWEMTFKEVRKLYLASLNIRALGVLYGLGAIGVLAVVASSAATVNSSSDASATGLLAFLAGSGLVAAAGCVSSFTRPRWGRAVGILLCVPMLFNFPLGTVIGILGLVAYAQGGKLFGRERLVHKDVAAVYRQRKDEK